MDSSQNLKQSTKALFKSIGLEAESKIIQTNGPVKNVHYFEAGNGKPLVMIHGGGANAAQWYSLMKPLMERFRIFVVDRPGCGLSDPFNYSGVNFSEHANQFVKSFMDSVGLDRALFLGNSMGAFFSVNFALRNPGRVEKLVMLGHPAGGTRKIPFMLVLMGVRGLNQVIMKLLGKPNREGTKKFFGMMLVANNSKLSDEFLQVEVDAALAQPSWCGRTMFQTAIGLGGFKKKYLIEGKIRELKMPIRYIFGDKDVFDTVEHANTLLKGMENAKVQIMPGIGHIPWLDDLNQSTKLVFEALED